ncbi:MAG: DUF1134 domain-containing protein [Sphingomonadaceae bacterium]
MTGRTLIALLALSLALPATAQQLLDAPPTVPEGDPVAAHAPAAPAPGAPAKRDTLASDARAATFEIGEIMTAADGAFGEATENVAKVIERVFADLGRPNAYIVGREGGGAVVVGLRYGRGRLFHKVEGEREVFWTGPSLGPDLGGDASRSFVLVYNLHDTEDLFRRFPAVEGKAYLIGGVSANYHRRGDIVLVPIRLGAGWRLGANLGYLRYTKEGRVLPF